ncbi:MAG: hypothetical protein ABC595_02935 [Candidatus Methanosuratincola petrocarbonis]
MSRKQEPTDLIQKQRRGAATEFTTDYCSNSFAWTGLVLEKRGWRRKEERRI